MLKILWLLCSRIEDESDKEPLTIVIIGVKKNPQNKPENEPENKPK